MAEIIDLEEYRFEKWYANMAWGYMTLDDVGRALAEQLERRIGGDNTRLSISVKGLKRGKKAKVIKIYSNKGGKNGGKNC